MSIQDVDGLDLAQTAARFIPKGTPIEAAVAAYRGQRDSEIENRRLRESGIDLYEARRYSKKARRKLEKLDNMAWGNTQRVLIDTAGGALGSLALTALVPVGGVFSLGVGLLGAFGGGTLTDHLQTSLNRDEQDVVSLSAEGYTQQVNRERHDPVREMATLLANLPAKKQIPYEEEFEKATGTKDFYKGSKTREGRKVLSRWLRKNDPDLEDLLRRYAHIPHNPNNRDQHVAYQYAELLDRHLDGLGDGVDSRDLVLLSPEMFRDKVSRIYQEGAVRDRMTAMAPRAHDVQPQRGLPMAAARGEQREV